MKTTSVIVLAGVLALMGAATAKEKKEKAGKKEIAPEILEKYDKDKDGKLSKEEKAAMKADQEANPNKEKKKDKKKDKEEKAEEEKTEETKDNG